MKMKKMTAVIASLCMMGAVVPFTETALPEQNVLTASAEEQTYQFSDNVTINYTVEADDTVTITSVLMSMWVNLAENETHLELPKNISGHRVTKIGDSAFVPSQHTVISVTLPSGVTNIGKAAFRGCDTLETVVLPDNLTEIGDEAFLNDSKLTDITLPANLQTIGESAFKSCTSLTSVELPQSLQSIGASAFDKCGLTSVTVPGSIKRIEELAFGDCKDLKSVVLEEGVEVITTSAFKGILSAATFDFVSLPETLTTIEPNAFSTVTMESLVIPKSVTTVGFQAFSSSTLKEVYILNPECDFSSTSFPNCTTTIYGYKGSTAEEVASQNSRLNFVAFGDADSSGKVDILDVITMNKAILGKESLSEEQLKVVDFNRNGKPESSETLSLMKYIVGIDSFLME